MKRPSTSSFQSTSGRQTVISAILAPVAATPEARFGLSTASLDASRRPSTSLASRTTRDKTYYFGVLNSMQEDLQKQIQSVDAETVLQDKLLANVNELNESHSVLECKVSELQTRMGTLNILLDKVRCGESLETITAAGAQSNEFKSRVLQSLEHSQRSHDSIAREVDELRLSSPMIAIDLLTSNDEGSLMSADGVSQSERDEYLGLKEKQLALESQRAEENSRLSIERDVAERYISQELPTGDTVLKTLAEVVDLKERLDSLLRESGDLKLPVTKRRDLAITRVKEGTDISARLEAEVKDLERKIVSPNGVYGGSFPQIEKDGSSTMVPASLIEGLEARLGVLRGKIAPMQLGKDKLNALVFRLRELKDVYSNFSQPALDNLVKKWRNQTPAAQLAGNAALQRATALPLAKQIHALSSEAYLVRN